MKQLTTPPPYTNRRGAIPGPGFRRCQANTKKGEQCRRGAKKGSEACDAHSCQRGCHGEIRTEGK